MLIAALSHKCNDLPCDTGSVRPLPSPPFPLLPLSLVFIRIDEPNNTKHVLPTFIRVERDEGRVGAEAVGGDVFAFVLRYFAGLIVVGAMVVGEGGGRGRTRMKSGGCERLR